MKTTYCWLCAVLTSLLILTAFIPNRVRAADAAANPATPSAASDDNYDRLDGQGASGKKVDVIEWEGNLEVHVTPKGSLKGLALKLDTAKKDKRVMVIGYRFVEHPETQLIRRAILGIDLTDSFKVYKDYTETDYDKIVISMSTLPKPLIAYKTEAAPTQLYPDGHPALKAPARDVASDSSTTGDPAGTAQTSATALATARAAAAAKARQQEELRDSGSIKAFGM